MKKVIVVLLIMAVFSCKTENKDNVANQSSPATEVSDEKKELIINIGFMTNKADEFKLMLNNILNDEFQRKNIHIIEKVIPTTVEETINANFGENISGDFQINLGNKIPKEVEITSMHLAYGNNTIQIAPENLNDYFAVNNKYVQFDTVRKVLKTSMVDGKHFPTIIMRKKTLNALQQE